jgi:hypothetical protein
VHENGAHPTRKFLRGIRWMVICVSLVFTGCDLIPRKVALDDPRIQPLLKAARSFDRTSYGFTPIPKSADVRRESRPTEHYDAMLHIAGKTSRTIAFRKIDSGWKWIGDQEIFQGPKLYKSVDGTFQEHICLTYEIEHISGASTNQLKIDYLGEDSRLAGRTLALADIRPILKEWGY